MELWGNAGMVCVDDVWDVVSCHLLGLPPFAEVDFLQLLQPSFRIHWNTEHSE